MKKIAIVTGTRAEYGLLKPLIKKVYNDDYFELQLYVTAMHLSPEFGRTIQEIEEDGFPIRKKIETLMSSNTGVGVVKSMGLTQISFAEAFQELEPDFLIVLGDRTEILSVVTAAYMLGVPVGHLHGGETTEGAYDEGIRHSITKMSYYHFTSTQVYKNRVIQLGESPDRVFNVGAIGLDSIKELELLSKQEFEDSIKFKLGKVNFLITYHPVTLENNSAKNQMKNLLKAVDKFDDAKIIITKPNSDKGGRDIIQVIDEYVVQNAHKVIAFDSLGQLRYLSALQYVNVVIGNSSSGLIEVPEFNIPTVNIGDRQKGRFMPKSVINSEENESAIFKAIKKSLSDVFLKGIYNFDNPYGNGTTSSQIIKILKKNQIIDLKKKFYDIK